MSQMVKGTTGNPTETADCAHGSSWTLNQELGSLHGAYLGPLHVFESCVAWSVGKTPNSEIRTCL